MGLFSRGGGAQQKTEARDAFPYPQIPPNTMTPGAAQLRGVNLGRADAALQKVAIWSSVQLIASTAHNLPGGVFRGEGRDKVALKMPQWLGDIGGDGYGLGDWIWQCLYSGTLRGNVAGKVLERNAQTGTPAVIQLAHPDDIDVKTVRPTPGNPRGLDWHLAREEVDPSMVWHQRIYPVPNRVLGLSPIAMHALTISQGIYAQQFGAQWFLDGAHPSSILTNSAQRAIGQGEATTIKQRFMNAVRGTREPVVLTGGWQYQAISVPAAESQFLETMGYTGAECARIYGPGMPEILGYETGGSMTYANVEQRSVDLLKYTLDVWFARVERWISMLLPQPQYFRLDRDALLRTDAVQRWTAHKLALLAGAKTINEVRTLDEDLPAVPWGDAPYLPALGGAAAGKAVEGGDVSDTPDAPVPAVQGGQQI